MLKYILGGDIMTKKIFIFISLIGIFLITILSYMLPNNPNKSINSFIYFIFDKPLWLVITISCSFIYLSILYYIYNKLKSKL